MINEEIMNYNKAEIEKWIQSFKIALLENNIQEAFLLTQNLPFDTNVSMVNANSELQEYLDIARELIGQTIEILQSRQDDTRKQIEKIRQTKKFFFE